MPAKTLQTRLILRNDTKSAWESANPVLRKGEVGVVFDPQAPVTLGEAYVVDFKIGDNVTPWNDLPLFRGPIIARLNTAEGKIATLEGQMAVVQGGATTEGSIEKALADAKAYADELVAGIDLSQIEVNKQAIALLNESATVAGSVAYAVKQETDRATGVEGGLDTRLQTAENKINVLEGNHFIVADPVSAEDRRPNVDPSEILPNAIYLVVKVAPYVGYVEWLYLNNNWEEIGDTDVDLSNYYTKPEINTMTATINGAISAVSTRVGVIEADYLKSVDTFILDCGTASTNISGS